MPTDDFNAWIAPNGTIHHVRSFGGHREWIETNYPGEHWRRRERKMLDDGWIRKAGTNSYMIGHERHLPRVREHVRRHHREHKVVSLDVMPKDGSWAAHDYNVETGVLGPNVRPAESVADILLGAKLYESATDVEYWTDVHGYHHGQTDATIYATPKGADRVPENAIGRLPYSDYQGNAHVNDIWTHPDHLRRGIASGMFDHLLQDRPYHEIKWGMTTPDGTQLKKAMDAKHGGYIRAARIQRGLERSRRRELGGYAPYLGGR